MSVNPHDPAFPRPASAFRQYGMPDDFFVGVTQQDGMSHRTAIAVAAMQGLLASDTSKRWQPRLITDRAVELADALIDSLAAP